MQLGTVMSSKRLALFFGFGLIVLLGFAVWDLAQPGARAQEMPAPADPPAPADQPAPKAGQGGDHGGKQNLFWHIIKSAGWVFGPLLLVISIGLVAIIVLLIMDLRMSVSIPPGFVEDFTETVNKRRFKEAFEMSRNDNSFLARVLTAGMSRLQYGIEDSREAAFNMVDSIRASKDQLITYLATIGTLGPMLGLVGTVFGMILAFMELARPGSTPRPDKLADGISHALVVTLLGIGLSVPAIFFHALFKNWLTRIAMDTSNIADDLLTQMYHNSKKPAAASTTSTDARMSGAAAKPGGAAPTQAAAIKPA